MAKSPPSTSSPSKAFTSSNRLLSALNAADRRLLVPHLTQVILNVSHGLEASGQPVEFVYFPESGIVSVVADARGKEVEVGIVGREGMTGLTVVMGTDRPTNRTYVQVAGHGQQISADRLIKLCNASLTLRPLLLRFVHVFLSQVSRTAFANARETMEARLARWLLMAHDRVDGEEIPLTHEFLSVMIGTTRPGVTVVLQALEERGLISLHRRRINVRNRRRLEKAANGSYGVPESEMLRLFPR